MPYEVHGGIAVPMNRAWELIGQITMSFAQQQIGPSQYATTCGPLWIGSIGFRGNWRERTARRCGAFSIWTTYGHEAHKKSRAKIGRCCAPTAQSRQWYYRS